MDRGSSLDQIPAYCSSCAGWCLCQRDVWTMGGWFAGESLALEDLKSCLTEMFNML